VQLSWRCDGLDLTCDVSPLCGQPVHVESELLIGGTLGRGPHDDAHVLGQNLLENLFEARPLGVGKLPADTVHRAVGHVDEVTPWQGHLTGQSGALVTDRVLRDLNENLVAGLQCQFDAPCGIAVRGVLGGRVPVDLAGVEHRVAPASDVDERRFHTRQHVLHSPQVDVADERGVLVFGDVVLHENAVFEHADLNLVLRRAHNHDPVNGFAAGEEFSLGDDGAAAACVPAIPAALLLRLKPGRALNTLRFGDQLRFARDAHLHDGVRGVVLTGAAFVSAPTTRTATDGRGQLLIVVIVVVQLQLGAVAS